MVNKGVTAIGLAAAGGVGYYLYTAGGDPKVAEKNFKADATEAQAKIKSEVPGKAKEYERKGEAQAAKAGQQFDKVVDDARGKLSEAQSNAKDFAQQTRKDVNQEIKQFDTTVERKTSEAKSGLSSWFGGK